MIHSCHENLVVLKYVCAMQHLLEVIIVQSDVNSDPGTL